MSNEQHGFKASFLFSDKEKLSHLIKEVGFSLAELSRLLEVNYKTVYRWLNENVCPHPRQSRVIDELFKEYVDLAGWVEELRNSITNPLKQLQNDRALQEKFLLLMTYHSNAIEGSRMTMKETQAAINGQNVKGKELFEVLEAINLKNALLYMLETICPEFVITEEYILKLHSLVMYNFLNKLPGHYRTGYVNLTNTEKKLPTAQLVPAEMRKLVKSINKYRSGVVKKASETHYEFESIHPFFDGNGRVGRIIMLTQLLSRGYPPALIEIEDRYKYYLALSKGDLGSFNNLIQMVCDSILKGYRLLFA
jgi:Fic family protein